MAITNYTELQNAVGDWLNRADLTSQIPDFIRLAESSLNKSIRCRFMVSSDSLALVANNRNVACPTDMLEPQYLDIAGSPLEQVDLEKLIAVRRTRMRLAGTPRYFAVIGPNIEFAPAASGSMTLDISYYAKIPALADNSTNWLLDEYPDVYLYASLAQAMPYLRDEPRAQVYNAMLTQELGRLVQRNEISVMDGIKVAGFSVDSSPDKRARVAPLVAGA